MIFEPVVQNCKFLAHQAYSSLKLLQGIQHPCRQCFLITAAINYDIFSALNWYLMWCSLSSGLFLQTLLVQGEFSHCSRIHQTWAPKQFYHLSLINKRASASFVFFLHQKSTLFARLVLQILPAAFQCWRKAYCWHVRVNQKQPFMLLQLHDRWRELVIEIDLAKPDWVIGEPTCFH